MLKAELADRRARSEIQLGEIDPEGIGPCRGIEAIDQVAMIANRPQMVDEMLGWSSVEMPSGTLTAR